MPTAILESRVQPFRVTAGVEQVAFRERAVNEIRFFDHKCFMLELLIFVAIHASNSLSGEGEDCTKAKTGDSVISRTVTASGKRIDTTFGLQ